ncbi:MAG: outer membrane lipoprotein carrier protein LolA [Bacteroidales bacterium]|nr:outer membrane lipoprotein carrier protein LolA [Bacteroidales bacterium]
MKAKGLLTLIVLLGQFLTLNAQTSDQLLENIEKANANLKTRSMNFSELREPAGKDSKQLSGTITYDPNSGMVMNYTDPGEHFVINGNTMTMKREGMELFFDLTKNKPMRTLSNMLMSSFNGQLRSLASSNNASIEAKKAKDYTEVTMKALKKAVKGYSTIVLRYDAKSNQIIYMMLEEFDGTKTTYELKK